MLLLNIKSHFVFYHFNQFCLYFLYFMIFTFINSIKSTRVTFDLDEREFQYKFLLSWKILHNSPWIIYLLLHLEHFLGMEQLINTLWFEKYFINSSSMDSNLFLKYLRISLLMAEQYLDEKFLSKNNLLEVFEENRYRSLVCIGKFLLEKVYPL